MAITYLTLKGKLNQTTKKNKINIINTKRHKRSKKKITRNKTKRSITKKPKPFSSPSYLYKYYRITPHQL